MFIYNYNYRRWPKNTAIEKIEDKAETEEEENEKGNVYLFLIKQRLQFLKIHLAAVYLQIEKHVNDISGQTGNTTSHTHTQNTLSAKEKK